MAEGWRMWAISFLTILLLALLSAAPIDNTDDIKKEDVKADNDAMHSHDENVTREGKLFGHNKIEMGNINVPGSVAGDDVSIGHQVNLDFQGHTHDHHHHEDDTGCKADEFSCSSGQCIDEDFRCDGGEECDDGSDEIDCEKPVCTAEQFSCSSGECIDAVFKCDKEKDCDDGSDEINCEISGCKAEEFSCKSGQCIDADYECDDGEDCDDGSDESDCEKPGCKADEFSCSSGQCIDEDFRCDGGEDCHDGSDEIDCEKVCTAKQFSCLSGSPSCIHLEFKCDGRDDCEDGSDEIDCSGPKKLWRDDGKCGTEHKLASGEPAQCDKTRVDGHCCSKWGSCGTGPLWCECTGCVNYAECTCSEFVDEKGFGKCQIGEKTLFEGSPYCYVNWPSSCTDLVQSQTNPKKWRSAEACTGPKKLWRDDGKCGPKHKLASGEPAQCDKTRVDGHCCSKWGSCGTGPQWCECPGCVNYAECTCSEFVDEKGFGKCQTGEPTLFEGSPYCYVNWPSSCTDLVQSQTNPKKWRSAEACTVPQVSNPYAVETVADANRMFACSLYNSVKTQEFGENLLMSPYSASSVMAMAYMGAKGETYEQMMAGMHFPEKNTLAAGYKDVFRVLKGNEHFNLETANKLFVQNGFELLDEFMATMKEQFYSKVEQLDFTKSEEASKEINAWVKKQTNNKIEELISKDALSVLTKMVLVNAIYFKGDWVHQFAKEDTKDEYFYMAEDEPVKVMMMHNPLGAFKMCECKAKDLQAKTIELPYKGDRISMYIVLPNEKGGLNEVETQLCEKKLKEELIEVDQQEKRLVSLFLPKFKMEKTIQMRSNLKELGMKDMFNTKADFSGINRKKNLFVKDVIQKAFLEVDELGSEAAAASAVIMGVTSSYTPTLPEFKCDHPFLFFIYDKLTNMMLFRGRVVHPTPANNLIGK